jgi:hypothetical protein
MYELYQQRHAELVRDAQRRRLARSGAWLARLLRHLAARGAMHRDSEARISRLSGGRI